MDQGRRSIGKPGIGLKFDRSRRSRFRGKRSTRRSRTFATAIQALAFTIVAVMVGCDGSIEPELFGRASSGAATRVRRLTIGGSSMVPTLMPAASRWECPSCEMRISLPAAFNASEQPATSNASEQVERLAQCTFCGEPMHWLSNQPADQVLVRPLAPERDARETAAPVSVGDLVLVDRLRWHLSPANQPRRSRWTIKRVLAVGGSTVDVDDQDCLTIDSKLPGQADAAIAPEWIEITPWIDLAVDSETKQPKTKSRWQSTSPNVHLFRHHSVHDFGLASPIFDDIPFNVSVARGLHPVTRLRVEGRRFQPRTMIDVVFAGIDAPAHRKVISDENGDWATSVNLDGGGPDPPGVVDCETAAVSRSTPVQLKVGSAGEVRLSKSIVPRANRWNRSPFPVRLADDEYFLVGDNWPVSLDSRNWGPASRAVIVGRVIRRIPAVSPDAPNGG